MVSTPLLTLDELSVTVPASGGRHRTILHNTSLSIDAGEVVAIVGPSGGGKSTLLKAILGLIPFTGGALNYEGVPTARSLDPVHQRLRAGTEAVFQNPLGALNPHATLRTAIEEPLRARRFRRAERRAQAEAIATRMGMKTETLDRKPNAVSLGQAQRACIARAIAPKPDILVLDEPLSALDALVAADVATLLAEVIADTQPTVLFVSHDMRLVRRLATRVIVIDAGRVVEDAVAAKILSAPQSAAARELVDCDAGRRAAFARAGVLQARKAIA